MLPVEIQAYGVGFRFWFTKFMFRCFQGLSGHQELQGIRAILSEQLEIATH